MDKIIAAICRADCCLLFLRGIRAPPFCLLDLSRCLPASLFCDFRYLLLQRCCVFLQK